jgi:hypothetical protein
MADIKVLLEQSNCFSSAAQAAFNANLSILKPAHPNHEIPPRRRLKAGFIGHFGPRIGDWAALRAVCSLDISRR